MLMHAKLHGEVQGVGFRSNAQKIATALHLTGFVRNHHDGTVEMMASGSKEALEDLLKKLNSLFTITHQEVTFFSSFEITK